MEMILLTNYSSLNFLLHSFRREKVVSMHDLTDTLKRGRTSDAWQMYSYLTHSLVRRFLVCCAHSQHIALRVHRKPQLSQFSML